MTSACILGCAGTTLNEQERALYAACQPFGFILFARNIEAPAQVRALVREMRAIVEREDAPVLIDQEGGRVQRLRPPHWPDFPPAQTFGELYRRDRTSAAEAARIGARLIAAELAALDINVDCLPVADLRLPEGHGIIGDRAYSEAPGTVAELAAAAADGLMQGGVLPVLKHIPGHGRARADSHQELPVVETELAELDQSDFEAFRRLAYLPIGMTAHVVYAAIDPERAGTISPVVVNDIIRERIGFEGLLLTDDLSMRALRGTLAERTRAALAAGCDIALHCNGRMDEMQDVAAAASELTGVSKRRADAALKRLKSRGNIPNLAEARKRFSAMLQA
jgi:beta-N-acetylhexosaminidase